MMELGLIGQNVMVNVSKQESGTVKRTWQTYSDFTDGYCQTALKYTFFGDEKHAKKIFGKIDF